MTRLTRSDLVAATPFPEDKPWLRAAIASLWTNSNKLGEMPKHLLPTAVGFKELPKGDL